MRAASTPATRRSAGFSRKGSPPTSSAKAASSRSPRGCCAGTEQSVPGVSTAPLAERHDLLTVGGSLHAGLDRSGKQGLLERFVELRQFRVEVGSVVLTDQVMPKMTGAQLIAAVKAEWPQLRLIIATGFAELPSTAPP